MPRRWRHAVVPFGVLCIAYIAACGGSGSQTGNGGPDDAGGKDDATIPSLEAGFGGDDEAGDGEAGGDDSTLGDSGDDAAEDASGDASDDTSDDATGSAGGDGGGVDASDAALDGGAGGDSGIDAGMDAASDAGGPDAGDGGQAIVDAGSDATAPDSGGASSEGGTCDFTGNWGASISIDVTWAAGGAFDIVIAPGSGTIKQWIRSARTVSGTTVTDTAEICGIQLPDFHGNPMLVDETYGIRFPDALFDTTTLTPFTIYGTVSGSTSTATYTTTPAAVLLGLTLPNPTTAVWPATITTANDQDLDGKPGVTANVAQGTGYSDVPLDFSVVLDPQAVARADRLYLAIRQVTSIAATFTDCDHASGTVTVPQITDPTTLAKKYAIDSHVIGCGLSGSTTDCTTTGLNAQSPFVDSNQPIFVPTSTTFTSARLPANTSCATVRSTLP
jgi:hypothetical protein